MNELKAFLDGELDAAASATMQSRLQSDGSLAATASDFRLIMSSFASLTQGPAVTGRERAMQVISSPRRSAFPWKLAGAVAGVLLLGFVVLNSFPVFSQEKEAAMRTQGMAGESVETLPAQPSEAAPGADLESSVKARAGAANAPLESEPSDNYAETPAIYDRKVIRSGSLELRVKSIEETERQVTKYVEGIRGYVENTTSSNLDGRTPGMTIVVRVPQAKFSTAMAAFEKLGERTGKDIQASDVTQQIVDLDARLKNLRSQEETYRAILRTARRVGEIIDVQERLSGIRGEIESMQAQRDSMSKLASLSTISVHLKQRPPAEKAVGGWAEDSWANATDGLGAALRALSVAAIWIAVYAPIWIPISIFAIWGWRRALRA
jgi:hypothetical protein